MTSPGVLQISSMKDRCSAAEWQARVDLAACYRLVDIFGMSDMMANHISSHVPGEPGDCLGDAGPEHHPVVVVGTLDHQPLDEVRCRVCHLRAQ